MRYSNPQGLVKKKYKTQGLVKKKCILKFQKVECATFQYT